MRTARARVTLVVATLAGSMVVPGVALADIPTTTVASATPANPEAGQQVCILTTTTVTSSGAWTFGGLFNVYETTSGSDAYVGGGSYQAGFPSQSGICLQTNPTLGHHSYRVDFFVQVTGSYDPSSDTVDIDVVKATPHWQVWTEPEIPEAGHPMQIVGSFADNGIDEQQTLKVYRNGIATPLCTEGPTNNDTVWCNVIAWPAGTYQVTVTNSGSANVEASTSPVHTLTIIPNQVHASGVGVSLSTFYPITDSYKDTVAIKGVREESASNTIRIYNPAGTLIKTQSIATGIGSYSWSWNGRKSDGTIYAEGKYKITQSLKDAMGTTKVFTHYVTLSKKRIYTYTKTITKLGSAVTAKGTISPGTVTLNTTSGYALLKANSGGWAGVGYEFSLPSATLYKSITFKVYAKDALSAPATQIALQNFTYCGYVAGTSWDTSCFDRWKGIGNSTNTAQWYSQTASLTYNRAGLKVRGLVSQPVGNVYVYKAQIVVTYGVLKY